jgi:D-amino-acid dehydrogenase
MKILILGAGVVGVTSAWYLARAGHEVTVLDRQPGAGMETSFANGGQISVSQTEPWANPAAPAKILKWLGRADAPLLFRLRADPRQWGWGLRFLLECLPSRTRDNTLTILRLGLYSRSELQALRRETGIAYDDLQKGILTIHTDRREFDAAHARVELLREHGLAMSMRTPQEVRALEPALGSTDVDIIGGTYARDDESGDAHLFTQRLAELAGKQGVSFGYGVDIEACRAEGDRISAVSVRVNGRSELLSADAFVVALGSHSPFLLSPLCVRVPVYPVKGYSVTIPVTRPEAAPTVCLTDENAKLAMSRLGDRVRAAGTAELTGYDTAVRDDRCGAILDRVRSLFPEAGDFSRATPWAGLRPATPSNVPVIGRTRYSNLFLNTGHGTLGWTLACGSAAALARLVDGRAQEVDFPFC